MVRIPDGVVAGAETGACASTAKATDVAAVEAAGAAAATAGDGGTMTATRVVSPEAEVVAVTVVICTGCLGAFVRGNITMINIASARVDVNVSICLRIYTKIRYCERSSF